MLRMLTPTLKLQALFSPLSCFLGNLELHNLQEKSRRESGICTDFFPVLRNQELQYKGCLLVVYVVSNVTSPIHMQKILSIVMGFLQSFYISYHYNLVLLAYSQSFVFHLNLKSSHFTGNQEDTLENHQPIIFPRAREAHLMPHFLKYSGSLLELTR